MDRRQFCKTSGSLALFAALGGTVGCRENAEGLQLLKDQGDVGFPLVIDTHLHTFNGSDLQVSKFISKVAVNEVDSTAIKFLAEMFGPILQYIAWTFAPLATQESEILSDYVRRQVPQQDFDETSARNREDQYRIAKRELERATIEAIEASGDSVERFLEPVESMAEEDQALSSLLDMPESYEELFVDGPEESGVGEHFRKLRAAQRFLVEMFQYRHVSTIRYFNTYVGDRLVVDLMTPCLVDYDWWLDRGNPTKSTLPEQIDVNEKIAALSHGRVHPFAPFDPFRQVMWDEFGEGVFSPIELVRDAVENRGFLGVKLYPPMGFGVYGNSTVDHGGESLWQGKDWLHPFSQSPRFAGKLDAALARLYEYSASNDVAVMAHSNPSNLSDRDFAPFLDIEHWKTLYGNFNLVGSYGHFNGMGSGGDAQRWQKFVDLLNAETGTNRRFADASYFSQVLSNREALVPILGDVLFRSDGSPSPIMQKLVYGSDWKMLLMEVDSSQYMALMVETLNQADQQLLEAGFASSLTNSVMGTNAIEFLGLRRGSKARSRLERFYHKYQIDEPLWMEKVDQQLRVHV